MAPPAAAAAGRSAGRVASGNTFVRAGLPLLGLILGGFMGLKYFVQGRIDVKVCTWVERAARQGKAMCHTERPSEGEGAAAAVPAFPPAGRPQQGARSAGAGGQAARQAIQSRGGAAGARRGMPGGDAGHPIPKSALTALPCYPAAPAATTTNSLPCSGSGARWTCPTTKTSRCRAPPLSQRRSTDAEGGCCCKILMTESECRVKI